MATTDSITSSPWRVVREGGALIGRFIREQPLVYALAAVGAVAFTSAIVASSLVIGHVTDDLIVPVLGDGQPIAGRLRPAVLLVLGVAVWKAAGIVVRRSAAGWLQFGAQMRLQKRVVAHLFELPFSWYAGRGTGDLLSVTDNDSRRATFVLAPLPFATGVAFLLVGTVVVVTIVDPWLGAASLALLLVVVALDLRGSWLTFAAMQEEQRRRGKVGETAHESFDGALTVKALGREAEETARFGAAVDELAEQYVVVGRTWSSYRAVTEGLPAVGTLGILLLGVSRMAAGAVTTGDLVQVTYLLSLLAVPVRLIGYLMWDIANSVAGYTRIAEVLAVDERVRHGDVPAPAASGPAPLTSDRISFGYAEDAAVLTGISFEVPAGRTLAVVGPTGSGKSTLAGLLARLWDPDDGAIRLDGNDLRDLARGALPAQVAYVAQDTFLFDDTVLGNLTLGRARSRAEVEEAVELASAAGFIDELPEGLDTRIGERGTTLSGGQQQRLTLARALLGRPRLLVLDDATSALDPSVEAAILKGLKGAALPSTVLVVAYRRSSIVLADEVLYLEDGCIRGHGTHEQLLDQVPGYARLLQAYDEDAAERAQGVA